MAAPHELWDWKTTTERCLSAACIDLKRAAFPKTGNPSFENQLPAEPILFWNLDRIIRLSYDHLSRRIFQIDDLLLAVS